MRQRLQKRFQQIWLLEWLNALVIFPLAYLSLRAALGLSWLSAYALGVVCLVLLVGGDYARHKYRHLAGERALDRAALRAIYRRWRIIILGALGALPILALVKILFLPGDASCADIAFAALFGVLALSEYINYYHWQLMVIDNRNDWRYVMRTRRLKRGLLARDPDL